MTRLWLRRTPLLDEHGIPDRDGEDRNLGLLARVTWVVEQMKALQEELA